jgi:hypothetical protein
MFHTPFGDHLFGELADCRGEPLQDRNLHAAIVIQGTCKVAKAMSWLS